MLRYAFDTLPDQKSVVQGWFREKTELLIISPKRDSVDPIMALNFVLALMLQRLCLQMSSAFTPHD